VGFLLCLAEKKFQMEESLEIQLENEEPYPTEKIYLGWPHLGLGWDFGDDTDSRNAFEELTFDATFNLTHFEFLCETTYHSVQIILTPKFPQLSIAMERQFSEQLFHWEQTSGKKLYSNNWEAATLQMSHLKPNEAYTFDVEVRSPNSASKKAQNFQVMIKVVVPQIMGNDLTVDFGPSYSDVGIAEDGELQPVQTKPSSRHDWKEARAVLIVFLLGPFLRIMVLLVTCSIRHNEERV